MPWVYFQALLLAVVTLALILIVSLSKTHFWLLLFLLGLIIFFWFLPRFIDLQRISPELTTPEGAMDTKHLRLQLEEEVWQQKQDKFKEALDFRKLIYILVVIISIFLIVISVMKVF